MMRNISTLLNQNSQLHVLAKQVQSHQLLQRFWQSACPALMRNLSTVGGLNNHQLTVYAHSAVVANKIKLLNASVLTQLQHLQQTDPKFRVFKVTAIVVKVQVKSLAKPVVKPPRRISSHAANSLNQFALGLGDSALATQLKRLASKT